MLGGTNAASRLHACVTGNSLMIETTAVAAGLVRWIRHMQYLSWCTAREKDHEQHVVAASPPLRGEDPKPLAALGLPFMEAA